jgi:hypothetical protein
MRKFIVKNRHKRKYIRKSSPHTSFTFSKTFVGSMPLIILAVALFTTLLMNMNLRDTAFDIRFTFLLPFTIDDILARFTALPNVFAQPGAFILGAGAELFKGVSQLLLLAGQGILQLASLVDPRPLIITAGQGATTLQESLRALMAAIGYGIASLLVTFMQDLTIAMSLLTQGLSVSISILAGEKQQSDLLIGIHANELYHLLAVGSLFVWNLLTLVVTSILSGITAVIDSVISVVRIPFDAMGSLWQQVKPYVAIFGKHIRMSGEDFSNGIESLNTLGAVLQKQ